MIEQFVKVIEKVLLNKETGNYDSALDEIKNGYLGIFGIDKELIAMSSAGEIIALLKLRGKDKPKVFLMLAEFLKEEAELQKLNGGLSLDKINDTKCKSLLLFLEAVINTTEFQNEQNYRSIDALLTETEKIDMSPERMIKTMHYFELKHEYAKAENILFDLIHLSPLTAATEGESFYNRLKLKSDEELMCGNFSRNEVQEGFSELRQRIKSKMI